MKFANKMHYLSDNSISIGSKTIKIEPIDDDNIASSSSSTIASSSSSSPSRSHHSTDEYHGNHYHSNQHQQHQQYHSSSSNQHNQNHHQHQQRQSYHQNHHQNSPKIIPKMNFYRQRQSESPPHQLDNHQSQQQQQQRYSNNKHHNVAREYHIDASQVEITRSGNSISIVNRSGNRCPRSPPPLNISSHNGGTAQIVITRAIQTSSNSGSLQSSATASSTTSSPTSSHHHAEHHQQPQQMHQQIRQSQQQQNHHHQQQQPQQHQQQQVRVICDGRLYDEESRRRIISPSPPLSSSSSSSSSHHHLHAPDSNLRILSSVAAVAAEEEQAAAAARKHANNNNSNNTNSDSTTSIVTRHVNVISSNLKSIDNNYNGTIQKSNISVASNNTNNNNNNNCVNNNNNSNSNNNSNTTIFRTPVVSSSSSNSISNGSSIKNNSNSGGGSNHINNNSNVMRPPPPPPPPKIKSTSALQSSQSSSVSSGSSSMMNNNNSEEPSSSIPDLEFDGTTVLCRVCGDKASGFHYGVHSCEGCKGFFRRSIQQKIQYRPCTKNQQCSILRINRNRCQYCRLKKCIAVGMSRDAVRFGRVPKREKARILAAMQQSTQNRGQQRQLATELDDQPRLLAAVLRAHMETCEFTKEKVAAMRQRARECPSYSMPTLLACPLNPAPELQSEQEFSERFAHVIRGVIDFAGMIPGFQLLNQDDKFTLLKAGLFDALFVRLICMFDSSINSIICLNGQVMRRDAIQNGANARFLVDSTFNFAERMNSMNLSDAEIGLFCAIVLITPDRPGLRNIELIDKMYSRLKGCLQTIINQNRPDQPDFMSELLKTLPDLRTLSTLHTEKLVVFRTEHKELLRQQMWQMEDDQPSKSPGSSGSNWDDRDRMIDDMAKSPMGSVSSTESGDIGEYSPQHHHHHHHYHGHNHHHHGHQSSLASSAPLLAATLSGTCPLRHRANSGSSAEDIDVVVGSHAHLTQNGLTITPVARSHSTTSSTHLLHHHLSNGGRYRKLDSPTDSGIESGNEKAESTKTVSSGGGSSCSSPRSSVDDALDAEAVAHVTNGHSTTAAAATTNSTPQSNNNSNASNGATKRQIVEDMPVLKRVLQAPPLYDTNSLMDEAYKPHKKFRALRHRDYDSSENDPHTTSTTGNSCNSSGTATSTTTPPIVQITPAGHSTSPSPSTNQQSTTTSSASPTTVPQNIPSPSPVNQQQSQLHMHLTRNLNTTTNNSTSNSNNLNSSNSNSNNNYNHHNNSNLSTTTQSTSAAPALSPQIPTNQQQHSSLSSTHSVLAKSLMAEPRMTPEQIKRSDIIQNYIMRGSSSSPNPNGLIVAQTNNNSNPPSQSSHNHHHHHYQPSASPLLIGNAPTSPSTTTVTLSSPPPPSHQHQQQSSGQQQHTMRWQGQSVITTTTLRQQSVSPHSNSSSCSNGSTTNSSYFQSPHSTSVSPPRPSPSATHSPRLIELQVDIADSQQPLNLSKKSPTPPPPLSVTTVSSIQQQQQHVQKIPAALVAHKYPSVSPDVTVTAATPNCPQVTVSPAPSPATTTTIHKVLLEA